MCLLCGALSVLKNYSDRFPANQTHRVQTEFHRFHHHMGDLHPLHIGNNLCGLVKHMLLVF